MNIDEIPTPESDAAYKQLLLESDKSHRIRMRSKMRDIERRLSVARGALMKARERIKYTDPKILGMEEIDQALTLTAPKP